MPEDFAPTRLLQRVRGRWPIALVLTGTFLLYVWNVAVNQWANTFYTAAIWSGSRNLEAAFFGSLDPSNAVSIDKPPAAFWLPEICVRLFGLHSWTVIGPDALLGVATVGMVYLIVRRVAGEKAALFGAVSTALTPVAALIFRYDNPDALLVFLLVAAGYAVIRATENGGRRWLVLAGLLIGLAVLAKMLQAGLVVPGFAAVYFLAAPGSVKRRVVDLVYTAAAGLVGCGWWFAAIAVTPASSRPFVDGTKNNSILDLVFGYNGFGRLTGSAGNHASAGAGPLRLLEGDALQMISWLLPATGVVALVAVIQTWRRPRADAQRATLLIGIGSIGISAVFFSFMGGIYHQYYTVALAPWIGVTVGVAAAIVGRRVLAVAVGVSALWSWHVLAQSPLGHYRELGYLVLVGGAITALAAFFTRGRVAVAALGAAALVVLTGPAAYSLRVPTHPYMGAIPVVGTGVAMGLPAADRQVTDSCKPFDKVKLAAPALADAPPVPVSVATLLRQAAPGLPWVAATLGSQSAAAYELASRAPVIAIGGFRLDAPSMTLASFQALVAQGKVRYFLPVCVWSHYGVSFAIQQWVWKSFARTTMDGVVVIDLAKTLATK